MADQSKRYKRELEAALRDLELVKAERDALRDEIGADVLAERDKLRKDIRSYANGNARLHALVTQLETNLAEATR